MIKIPILNDAKLRAKAYSYFRGCDFTTDPAEIDESRSPDSLNMIADDAGFPVKRVGWRVLNTFEGKIYGMHYAHFAGVTNPVIVVHHGTKLSAYDFATDTKTNILASGMATHNSQSFMHKGYLYILDGTTFRRLTYSSGYSCTVVANDAKVPTTGVGGHYEAEDDGEGNITYTWTPCTAYEEPNLLTNHQRNELAGDGVNTDFWLTERGTTVTTVEIYGGSPAAWTVTTAYTATEDTTLGKTKITFSSAPAAHPDGAGIDNIRVEFTSTENPEKKSLINKCSICAPYGYFNDNRIFVAGNTDYKNRDWACGVDDPTYWEKNQWTDVGSDHTAIMGYLHYGDVLAIVKEDDNQDAEIYIRSASVQSDNKVLFPVQQGVKGVGAISTAGFASLRDDALFYAREGVFAVAGTDASQQRTVQNRSFFVDNKMREEPHKENAVAVTWNNRYLLCFPDSENCYVADSRMQSAFNESFVYEWFYWTNIPARVFLEFDGELYFGTNDGRLCRFNDDFLSMVRYSDGITKAPYTIYGQDSQPYNERSVASASVSNVGDAELDKIVGGTVAWNQLAKAFSSTDWTHESGVTDTYSDGVATLSNPNANSNGIKTIASVSVVSGHKYIVMCSLKAPSTMTNVIVGASSSYGLNVFFGIETADTWLPKSKIVLCTNTGNTPLYVYRSGAAYTDLSVKDFCFADLTIMFGSTIADYIYALEQSNAGSGVAYFRKLFPKSYYAYDSGSLQSVNSSAHKTYKADTTLLGNYELDSSLTLRGILKLDSGYNLYYDGDTYEPDGTVTRKYGTRAYEAGDATSDTMITDGTNTVYKLPTPTTESAAPFMTPQKIDPNGTEEYVDYAYSQGTRDVKIPVGHETQYTTLPETEAETWTGGRSILARWTTKADTFGTIARVKTLTKRGCTVMLKPYAHSSVKIIVTTHDVNDLHLNDVQLNVWDFGDLDFARIDFNAMLTPQVVPIGKKVKKFQQLQIKLESNGDQECFGLYGIQVQYTVNNYIK